MAFQLLPDHEEDIVEKINGISYVKETFHDLLAHEISITITFILDTIEDLVENDAKPVNELKGFINKWKKNVAIDRTLIETVFYELKQIIDKNKALTSNREFSFLSEIIDLYVNLYSSMLDLKKYIIPGIDSFELIVDANEKSKAISLFLNNLDYLLGFINKPLCDKESFIEGQYHSEEVMNYIVCVKYSTLCSKELASSEWRG